jgi:1-acyl-sn-glycerol-3-phosphate acyltransferase
MIRKIHKWSFFYRITWLYVYLAQKLFYDKIVVKGLENIPLNSPVILAPNHQNAFMDALIIACAVPGQTVFMARADVFQNKWLARIFRFLKIMPVYRIRDGFENLEKNTAIFDEAIEVLQNRKILCLMPEGTHGNKHSLKPLVKGVFRIGLSAAEKFPEFSPVIIPVGIEYSNYTTFRSQVVIQFGEPIHVTEYSKLYNINPAKAINELRGKLSQEMQKLMLHIDCVDLYETVDYLRQLYRPFAMRKLGYDNRNPWLRYLADKWFTEICNTEYKANSNSLYNLIDEAAILHYKMDIIQLDTETLLKKEPGIIKKVLNGVLLFILFPFFAAGYITNIGFVRFARIINNKIEDTQFHSSIKFTCVVLLFPFYYSMLWYIISIFEHHLLIQLLLLLGLAFLGEFAFRYFLKFKNFSQMLKLQIYKKEINSIYPLWKSIIAKIDMLCNCPNSKID